jgi:hypothetical protein
MKKHIRAKDHNIVSTGTESQHPRMTMTRLAEPILSRVTAGGGGASSREEKPPTLIP